MWCGQLFDKDVIGQTLISYPDLTLSRVFLFMQS